MKRTVLLFISLLLFVSLLSCQGGEALTVPEAQGGLHGANGDYYPEEFLTFNGETVTFAEFRCCYLNFKNKYLEEDPDYFSQSGREEALKTEALQYLLDTWSVRFMARDQKIGLDREEKETVLQEIQSIVNFYGGEESFQVQLAESYMSESLYQYMMECASLQKKLFDTLFAEGGKEAWSDEKFYEYYRANYLAVQQIYLPYGEEESKTSCAATLSLANGILEEIQNGKDFWKLIEVHSADEYMLDYPDGYYFTRGEAEDALYEASAALEIGTVSKPVLTESGIYLIKRMEMKEIRMQENRQTALYGYVDSYNEPHSGAYDQVFKELYTEYGKTIRVEYGSAWDEVNTKTVY